MQLNFKKIGEGKPFIILHGLFGSGDNLQTFAKSLSVQGYAVYSVDLRNHGHSPHADEHNYKVMIEDIADFIEKENLQDPIVLGHSMGGKVAMQLAIDNPTLISKLIVVDIAPYYYPVHHQKIIAALQSVDLNLLKTRGEVEKKLALQMDDVTMRQFLLKNLFWKTDTQLAWRFNLEVLAKDINKVNVALESETPVKLPVLFVKGERSDYINVSKFDSFKELFPYSTLVEIKNAGHWVHAENPGDLLNAIIDFLKKE